MYEKNQVNRSSSANSQDRSKSPSEVAAAKRRAAARQAAKRKKRIKATALSVAFLTLCVGLLVFAIIMLVNKTGNEDIIACATDNPTTTPSGDYTDSTLLPAGVSVNGVSVGGLTVAQAKTTLEARLLEGLSSIAVTLSNEYINTTLSAEDMGAHYDIESAVAELAASPANHAVEAVIAVDTDVLTEKLTKINETIPNHATNATVTVATKLGTGDMTIPYFEYTEGTNGMQLDYDAVIEEITTALTGGQTVVTITPKVTVSEPAVTAAMLKSERTLLASYSTTYRFKGVDSMTAAEVENVIARDVNITKAAAMMQYIELEPGQIFSFNGATGNRSEANGWAYANAVYDKSYRKETGGGVCQISTTMFNALLKANVEIIERKAHSIPSDYVTARYEDGLGFDATVDYGHIDFRFRNNYTTNIYVLIYVTRNAESSRKRDINVEIYGESLGSGVDYRLRNEILEHTVADTPEYIEDKTQPVTYDVITRKAHDYYKVKTYVDLYVDNVFVKTVYTEITIYEMIQEQHTVGTMVDATPTPAITDPPLITDPPVVTSEPFIP